MRFDFGGKMKIPAIRGHVGDWVYYIATMSFKDVSEYVKRVDNELHKSDLLKQMLQRSITKNYESIARYIETQEERFFNSLVLVVVIFCFNFSLSKLKILDKTSQTSSIFKTARGRT